MAANVGACSRLSAAEEFMRSFDLMRATTIWAALKWMLSDLHQIAVGTGHTAVAATHIHSAPPRNFR